MKSRKNKTIAIVVVGVVVIVALVWYVAFFSIKGEDSRSVDATKTNASGVQTDDTKSTADSKFSALKGEDFDKAFIADMLAHHEGAVSMAEQAQSVTAHDEIRKFAGDITMMQSMEIVAMRGWQKDWGYEITMSGGHMSHGGAGMDMGGDMVEMMNKLTGLTGEAYDKEFLKQMIIHHGQAVAMSQYAENNAQHTEVKQLARGIIASQAAEIEQMKQWQKEWGY